METTTQILEFLDRCFQEIKIPCFGNLNIDYLDSRLMAFRDQQQWLLIFNSIAWCPAGEGLTTLIECVGNCPLPNSPNFLVTGKIIHDPASEEYQVTVRGNDIALSELDIISYPDLFADRELDIAIALLPKYREQLFANREEYGVFIPAGMDEILRLDQWHHPDWSCPPSQTLSFPMIAEVLVTGDRRLYQPPAMTNTHWQNWFPK